MFKDWKSAISGILSFLITTLTILNTFLVAGNINTSGTNLASIHGITWITLGVNVGLALCRGWIGLVTTNADADAVAKAINRPTSAPALGGGPLMSAPSISIPRVDVTSASLAATPPKV